MSQFNEEANRSPEDEEEGLQKSVSFASGWDPLNKHVYAQPTPDMEKASQVILSTLQPRRSQETIAWLANLNQEVLAQDPRTQKSTTLSRPGANQTEHWVDVLFDKLERLSVSFNRTATGTDLITTVIRPNFLQLASATSLPQEGGILYAGHVATRFWALLMRGFEDSIEIFVVPAQNLISLSNQSQLTSQDYTPFMTISAPWASDTTGWAVNGTNLTEDMLTPLARELFGDLIRVASGKMSESELHSVSDPKLGETVAVGYEPVNVAAPPRKSGDMSLTDTNVLFALSSLVRVIDSELGELHDVLARTVAGSTDADAQARIAGLETLRHAITQAMKDWQASLPKDPNF